MEASIPTEKLKKDSGRTLGGGVITPHILFRLIGKMMLPIKLSLWHLCSIPTDGSDRALVESRPELRYSPLYVGGQQGGVSLWGYSDGPLEQENHPDQGSRADHTVRRINPGLGSDMPGF